MSGSPPQGCVSCKSLAVWVESAQHLAQYCCAAYECCQKGILIVPDPSCRLLHTYPGGWQVYLAPDGQEPQLLTVLVRESAFRLLCITCVWFG